MIFDLFGNNVRVEDVQSISTPYLYKESYHAPTVVVYFIMYKGAFAPNKYNIPLIDGEISKSDVSSDYIKMVEGHDLWIDSNGQSKENVHNVKPLTGTVVSERVIPVFRDLLKLL